MTNLLALPDGTELVGDYRIKRVLGAGGFGITYLADEIALARLVTIKEYFPADFAARGAHQRCLAALAGLRRATTSGASTASSRKRRRSPRSIHPNIVRVYRYFRANNTGYMVLHFEEGGSFKAWLKGLGRAPRQTELDTHPRAAARRAGDGPQGATSCTATSPPTTSSSARTARRC